MVHPFGSAGEVFVRTVEAAASILKCPASEILKGRNMATVNDGNETPKRFSELTGGEKFRFVCKAFVFFVSGGFVYPTLWVD